MLAEIATINVEGAQLGIFYSWNIRISPLFSLSGLSPFLGETDEETLANVAAADWDYDDPAWDDISDLAKDFICRLMVKDRRYNQSSC